jgi:protein SCO1/2
MIKRLVTLAALAVAIAGTLAGAAWAAPKNSPWGPNYFPNVPLRLRTGRRSVYDDLIKDKKVLINFTFVVRRQLPARHCELLKVQKMLGSRVGRISSLLHHAGSERDTPKALKGMPICMGWRLAGCF